MDLFKTKSRVISAYDFRDIDLSTIIPPFEADSEQLESDIQLLRKQNCRRENVDTVKRDDLVTLSCSSSIKKFNKEKITLRTGKGLFNKELEEKLIGLRLYESAAVQVDGETVEVKILSITRNVLPELTDENVKCWGIDNVSTVEELKVYLTSVQKSAYIDQVSEGMAGEVQRLANEKSTFELDDREIENTKAESKKFLWSMLKTNGIDPDNSTDEEIQMATGMTLSQHKDFMEGMFIESFKSDLISYELIKKNNVVFTNTDYENALLEQMKFMETDNEEETRKTFTFDIFIKQKVSDYYFNMVESYIKDYLRKN